MFSHKQLVDDFEITEDDEEYLMNLLLETETPMSSHQIASTLIEKRINEQSEKVERFFKDVKIYDPANQYDIDDKIAFPTFDLATANVLNIREGNNPDTGAFNVIGVAFDNAELNNGDQLREFASNLTISHNLNDPENVLEQLSDANPDEIIEQSPSIIKRIQEKLSTIDELSRVTDLWFPTELVPELDVGQLHLAEAVIDMSGSPLPPDEIIEQTGGLADIPKILQLFAINLALSRDSRFDEVGTAGEVLWYLSRLEPKQVRECPEELNYTPVTYDPDVITPAYFQMEQDIEDELSDIHVGDIQDEATITLIYPHRKAGTLPINASTRQVFPQGKTQRIWIELIDEEDGEVFHCWVVHNEKYVFGVQAYFEKYQLPVGTFIHLKRGEKPDQIIISVNGYKPRSEWILVAQPADDQIVFENSKRQIGAEYDDLISFGVDDLQSINEISRKIRNSRLPFANILRDTIRNLSVMNPQGAVHAKSLYSAVNIFRRCPPGPIFATLLANPDFESVGEDYWKLSGQD